MALNLAFEVDELAIADQVYILAGSLDPAIALADRPVGSLYVRTNGELWQKTGTLPNQWNTVSGATMFGNIDGGHANAIYSGGNPIDGGNSSGG